MTEKNIFGVITFLMFILLFLPDKYLADSLDSLTTYLLIFIFVVVPSLLEAKRTKKLELELENLRAIDKQKARS